MLKNRNKSRLMLAIIPVVLAILLSMLPIINTNFVNASIGATPYTPRQVISDNSSYNNALVLSITEEEKPYLPQIDLNRFTQLERIELQDVLIEDGTILDLEKPIHELLILGGTVINLSTLDLNDFDYILIRTNVISIGDKIDDTKVYKSNLVNEEYYEYSPEHDALLNQIASEIYIQSNKTPDDIIRRITLYVLENTEYDSSYTEPENSDTLLDDVLLDHKGVCEHYARLESILLNKLGIFATYVHGPANVYYEDGTQMQHAWNAVYKDGRYYAIDPTFLDNAKAIAALKNDGLGSAGSGGSDMDTEDEHEKWSNNPLRFFMQDIDNEFFNQDRTAISPTTALLNRIPVQYRISNMSILSSIELGEEETDTNIKPNELSIIPRVPNTGGNYSSEYNAQNNPIKP